jgi:hypothetical protein
MIRALVIAAPILIAAILWYVATRWPEMAVAVHQRSVTRELAEWAEEYRLVRTWAEADRGINMLEYVQWYYVPAEGYRSDPSTEAALETQRTATVNSIVAGLREFTGQDFGSDLTKWRAWRASIGKQN